MDRTCCSGGCRAEWASGEAAKLNPDHQFVCVCVCTRACVVIFPTLQLKQKVNVNSMKWLLRSYPCVSPSHTFSPSSLPRFLLLFSLSSYKWISCITGLYKRTQLYPNSSTSFALMVAAQVRCYHAN